MIPVIKNQMANAVQHEMSAGVILTVMQRFARDNYKCV